MRLLIAAAVLLCGCSAVPEKSPPPPPVAAEYKIPLLLADGTVSELTVEDNKPHEGVRIVFCKEMPNFLACLADERGKQVWMSIPFAAAPDPKAGT